MRSFQKSEHTGGDRCWPCTVVNLGIAAVLSLTLVPLSPALAGSFLIAAALVIAYVGYLVPGTPTLTRRYLPERILARFGKASPDPARTRTDGGFGPDRLVDLGVLEAHDDGTLSLSQPFADDWGGEIEALRNDQDAQRTALSDLLGIDPDDVAVEPIDSTGALSVRLADGSVSQWISRAALIADGAAGRALSSLHPAWTDLSVQERHELLVGLRQFRDRCPACGGAVESRLEDTATCCWTSAAVTARCEDCGDRLYVITEHPE